MAHDDEVVKQLPESGPGDEPDSSKREFLSKSGALLAVLGALSTGTVTTRLAQKKPEPPVAQQPANVPPQATRVLAPNEVGQMKLVLSNAMQTGNMDNALKLHGQGLSPDVAQALRSL